MHREFWMNFMASSAVNLPMSNATLRLVVIWTRVESTRCTYTGTRVPPRFTFTTNLIFFMCLLPLLSFREKTEQENGEESSDLFLRRHTYRLEMLATPHSKQRGFSRDVINPQNGHILCDRNPATSGFSLRIQWSSRIVNSPISRPKEILVTFTKRPFLASSASTQPVAQAGC